MRAYVFADARRQPRRLHLRRHVHGVPAVHDAVLARLAARFGNLYTREERDAHGGALARGVRRRVAGLRVQPRDAGLPAQVFDAEVDGVVEAIVAAHDNLAAGTVAYGRSELKDASVNRSRAAFDRNPQGDKDYYPARHRHRDARAPDHQGGDNVGGIGWFPTHGASLTNKNHLISGDNKGAARVFLGARCRRGALPRRQARVRRVLPADQHRRHVSPNWI
ncbi:hypothetical protein GS498_22400 [Rhodococcus hoagii]|nr:hypothetical protein [Prescottella equi]